jgi:DNA-binding NarL/FixJ family response regulator
MKILIADDHQMVRRGLRTLLEKQDGWEVCGEAETGHEAIDKTKELKPDIVVLDISMPLLNGFAVAKTIKELHPETAVVVYSVYASEAFLREALRIGLDGYVSKTDRWQEIVKAVEEVERRGVLAGVGDKPAVRLTGTVEKVIPPIHSSQPEKAQISIEGAEELYKEIRVENTLQDGEGNQVALKQGAQVEVTIEADPEATKPKNQSEIKKPDQSTDGEHRLNLRDLGDGRKNGEGFEAA